jgi:hypothetical protein
MTNWQVGDWVILIGAISTMATSIIAAIKSNRANIVGHENKDKIENLQTQSNQIKVNTDGNIAEMKEKVLHAERVNEHLLEVVTCLVDQLPEGSLMKAKREVEKLKSEIGYRRSSDFHSNFSRDNLAANGEKSREVTLSKEITIEGKEGS